MALKSYEELIKVDVRQYCEERDGFTYLNWAKCIELLRQNGATEVYWEPIPDPQTGSSLRKTDIEFKDKNNNTNRCYETRIKVVIDDKEYEMQTPVMNGANPVKDNSMSQQRVWNSMCRAFVKCVAIHTGLGFNLWLKEEYNKLEAKIPGTGENLASEAKKKTLKTQCTAHGIDLDAWVCGNGKTVDGPCRSMSEKYGFVIPIAYYLHENYPDSVHQNPNKGIDLELKQMAQKYFEEHYGTREEFREIFGKSRL